VVHAQARGPRRPRRLRGVLSALLWGVLVLGLGAECGGLPTVRADYIAEIQEGGKRGYLYIGKGRIKRQALTGWPYGDLIIRDDKKVMYFTTRRMGSRGEERGRRPIDVERAVAEVREKMETSEDFSANNQEVTESDLPTYVTTAVDYSRVQNRRGKIVSRVMQYRQTMAAHVNDAMSDSRSMLRTIAMYDIFCSGKVNWTNTGETEVIAGRECTKYRMRMAPIFKLDVWMTTELGPGYVAGHMFAKPYGLTRGGVRPMEELAEIPGFPMKMEGQYKQNPAGGGTMSIKYEVISLIETDLDEQEFEPRPGSRVSEGALPGYGGS